MFATEVFDKSAHGRQALRVREDAEGSQVELSLEYTLAKPGPLGPLTDLFFIRRAHILRGFPFDIFDRFLPPPRGPAPAASPEVNRILAKIHTSGLESLTTAERLTLHRASQAARG